MGALPLIHWQRSRVIEQGASFNVQTRVVGERQWPSLAEIGHDQLGCSLASSIIEPKCIAVDQREGAHRLIEGANRFGRRTRQLMSLSITHSVPCLVAIRGGWLNEVCYSSIHSSACPSVPTWLTPRHRKPPRARVPHEKRVVMPIHMRMRMHPNQTVKHAFAKSLDHQFGKIRLRRAARNNLASQWPING